MAIQQRSYFCPNCQQQRLFTRQGGVNHILHFLIMIFSCGLWAIVWGVLILSDNPRFHCSQCGFSDAPKYLANPNLRSQESQQNAQRAALQSSSPSAWFLGLSSQSKIFAVLGVLTFIGLSIFVVATVTKQSNLQPNANSTSNSSSNKMTAFPTPKLYPAGLSPAENLEKGKKALNAGDQYTAWTHLFHIKKVAKEYAAAQQLLASIGERERIEFELELLNEREENVKTIASGLAYKVEPNKLKEMLDNNERVLREIYARRQELNRKLEKMP